MAFHRGVFCVTEIQRFIEKGSRIISDGMASYNRLPEYGYVHDVVVHEQEFVGVEDRSVHTQNIEIRNRWMKRTIKSYKSSRALNSYAGGALTLPGLELGQTATGLHIFVHLHS